MTYYITTTFTPVLNRVSSGQARLPKVCTILLYVCKPVNFTRFHFKILLSPGMHYLHEKKILHRDLKSSKGIIISQ